jgi:hypothetical protein
MQNMMRDNHERRIRRKVPSPAAQAGRGEEEFVVGPILKRILARAAAHKMD